jgi:hypothetical protein
MDAPKKKRGRPSGRGAPAKTVEGRENQLISKAVDLAEKQLEEGTASSQVITHFLKLGTVRAKVELEKLQQETLLLSAKTEALESAKRMEALYINALNAMRSYQGFEEEGGHED